MAKFYIVWNPSKNEGFITSDEDDAYFVCTGERLGWSVSLAGEAFREAYCGDDDDDPRYEDELPMQELELP